MELERDSLQLRLELEREKSRLRAQLEASRRHAEELKAVVKAADVEVTDLTEALGAAVRCGRGAWKHPSPPQSPHPLQAVSPFNIDRTVKTVFNKKKRSFFRCERREPSGMKKKTVFTVAHHPNEMAFSLEV